MSDRFFTLERFEFFPTFVLCWFPLVSGVFFVLDDLQSFVAYSSNFFCASSEKIIKKNWKKIVVIDKSYQLAVIATIIGVNATVVVYWANTTTHLSTQICASVMSIFSRRRRRRERHDCLWRNFLVVFFLIFISVQRFFFCSFYLALSGAPF